MTAVPNCPVTGLPAKRLVQYVSAELLTDLWRYEFRVDVRPSFKGATRFGLWESFTGLRFFDPMLEGDAGFYTQLYDRMKLHHHPHVNYLRAECILAAEHVGPGDRVLDVGCGFGAFRHAVPHASYLGLDPHFSGHESWARTESLADHLDRNAGGYDVVTAFQVLEHVDRPVAMVADMARAVRPGGTVIIGVPHVPSAHTRVPNLLINALPHHLTWWTEAALEALAERLGLVESTVRVSPWNQVDSIIYWMARCSPVQCHDRHFKHDWGWHASAAMAFLGGYALWKLCPNPRRTRDEGAGLLLVAKTPG